MAIGDYYKLAFELQFAGQVFVNTFHFRQDAAAGAGQPENAEGLIYHWKQGIALGPSPYDRYVNLIPGTVTVYRMYAFCLTNLPDAFESVVNIAGGRGSGELCPTQCATVITWRTPNAGRRFRGRTFIGPVREADQVSGLLEASLYLPVVNLFRDAMLTKFGAGGSPYRMVVYSRVLDTGLGVTAGVTRTAIKTQRRRARLGT